ncbi:MAG TPA: glycosyltransferase family 39 protein [Candidatus Sulfomarinibacteraceae bacterium]|nr:glycosyltransferase family 39 protein [Candidatus Sulfomarinibacteraceae bacterium]
MFSHTFLRQRVRFILPPLIFVAALLPRLAALGRYVTPDELIWVQRSLGLRQALLRGNWAETIQSGHPGITTTWIGAVAIQIQLWLEPALASQVAWLEQLYWLSTENAEAYRRLYLFLSGGRLGVALVTSLGLVLVYLLGRPLLGNRPALLAAGLLALDPFFAGLSGLLHVDALLATFILLALLLALHAGQTGRPLPAALAGVTTGLAILTKTPGLILLVFIPAIVGWSLLRNAGGSRRQAVAPLGAWLGAVLVTVLVLLPALWTAPRYVLAHTAGLTGQFVDDAARQTFFLGQMTPDPGPLFYPVALLLRLSPAASLGLLAGLAAITSRRFPAPSHLREVVGGRAPYAVLWLLLFAIVYLSAISLASLKYDRYALPALAALTIVAAWGIVWLARRLKSHTWHALALIAVLQGAYLVLHLPYPLLAYNWLAGGQTIAARALPVGWGEGSGAAVRWLAQSTPDSAQSRLFATNLPGTAPFYDGPITRLKRANLSRLQPADYLLVTDDLEPWSAAALQDRDPLHTFDLGPGEQARIYNRLRPNDFEAPQLRTEARQLRFGPAIEVTAAGAVFLPWPDDIALAVDWRRLPGVASSDTYRLQLALVNENGPEHLQHEIPLLNQNDHPPAFWPANAVQAVHYIIATPPDIPPGDYRLVARLFNAEGEQQGVFDGQGRFVGTQGELDTVTAQAPRAQPPLDIPQRVADAAPLRGHGSLPQQATTGQTVGLDLWWQAVGTPGGRLALEVGGVTTERVAVDATGWAAGQVYRLRPTWRVPLDAPAGVQPLRLTWLDDEGQEQWAQPITLGQIDVQVRERRFELPAGLDALGVQIGSSALLQGASVEVEQETVRLNIVWQANEQSQTSYTTFVHLRDEQGTIVAQADRRPQPPTDSWAAGEVIVETYELARPPAGAYTLALGLYDAENGVRLPVYDAQGAPLPHEQYVLEVVVP